MRRYIPIAIASLFVVIFTPSTHAAILYATSYEGKAIYRCDTTTLTNTLIYSTVAYNSPDSLLFDPAGRIIYTAHLNNTIQAYDPVANTDTTIGTGTLNPADMVLDPSGSTLLVADYNSASLRRVSLAGGPTTLLVNNSFNGGLAYANGHLFAVANHNQVDELNPATGAIINSSILNTGLDLDGLNFDPYTNHLWASDLNNNALVEFTPGALTYTVHPLPPYFGGSLLPDGMAPDGAGLIYFASRKSFNIYSYDISTTNVTQLNFVYGLDDLAPLVGSGAIPEPSTLALAVIGLPMLLRRRESRKG